MVPRLLYDRINKKLFKGKALIITGPRQSGKTKLIQHLANNHRKAVERKPLNLGYLYEE